MLQQRITYFMGCPVKPTSWLALSLATAASTNATSFLTKSKNLMEGDNKNGTGMRE